MVERQAITVTRLVRDFSDMALRNQANCSHLLLPIDFSVSIHSNYYIFCATPDVLTRTEDKAKRVLHVQTPQYVRLSEEKFYVHFQCNKQVSFFSMFSSFTHFTLSFYCSKIAEKEERKQNVLKKSYFHEQRFARQQIFVCIPGTGNKIKIQQRQGLTFMVEQ